MKIKNDSMAPLGSELSNFSIEVSYGGQWIDLNDHERFYIGAESLAQSSRSFRTVKTSSPVIEGDFLVHSVADMVSETIKIRVFGDDMTDLNDNILLLSTLFEQFNYSIRITRNEYREVWNCQQAGSTMVEAGQVWLHNMTGWVTAVIPRYPTVSRERVSS